MSSRFRIWLYHWIDRADSFCLSHPRTPAFIRTSVARAWYWMMIQGSWTAVGNECSDNQPIPDIVRQQCSLTERIADAISGVDDWRGVTDPVILADAVIAELGPELTHQHCGWHDAEDCKCRCCNPDYYRAWLEDQQ